MEDKEKNQELQSRREFFKRAAKKALPIVGAVVLASVPLAESKAYGCTGYNCTNGCEGCNDTCYGSCRSTCVSNLANNVRRF